MDKNNAPLPDLPVIEKNESGKRRFVVWRGKKYGPWDELGGPEFTLDRRSWEVREDWGRLTL